MDRRQRPRVTYPFPALVQAADSDGEWLEVETVLDNLSASGLYVRLHRHIERGARLRSVIELPHALPRSGAESKGATVPRLKVAGVVVRSETIGPGEYGVAVRFTRHRFL